MFIVSEDTYNKLISFQDYPITKEKAIKKILVFLDMFNLTYYDGLYTYDKQVKGISYKLLIHHFNRDNYKKFIKIMTDMRFISEVAHPAFGGKYSNFDNKSYTKTFKMSDELINSERKYLITIFKSKLELNLRTTLDKKMIKALKETEVDYTNAIAAEIAYVKNLKTIERKKIHRSFFSDGKNVIIYKKYKDIINEKDKTRILNIRLSRLLSMQYLRYATKGVKVDRVYNSLATMSSVSRKFIYPHYISVDVKNSQPLLLCKEAIKDNSVDENYKMHCEAGCFYEEFYNLSDLNNIEGLEDELRKDVKTQIYSQILFDFKEDREYNQRFKSLYPKTWKWIKDLTDRGETLASTLQNAEAEIFNSFVPKRSKMYFTVYDAFYFTDSKDIEDVCNHIKTKFNENGMVVQLDIKY